MGTLSVRMGLCSEDLRAALVERGAVEANDAAVAVVEVGTPFPEADSQLSWLHEHGVRTLACSAHEQLASKEIWRLLACGADDVLTAQAGLPEAVIARLQRWVATEQMLSSPLVRNNLLGQSAAWRNCLREVVELGVTNASVLLLGETGTGKELLSRLIHALDQRTPKGPLIVLDCTTLAPELAGSELFGHERGAFTGAIAGRTGAFEQADGGTLFLDEVGELPLALQAQLLRAIQERSYKPVGGSQWRSTQFRLVCATHRDLRASVAAGQFRADLFHRLAASVVHVPPLRERRMDILPLFRHFASEVMAQPVELDSALEGYVVSRDYSGNVRELRQFALRVAHQYVGLGPLTAGAIPREDRPEVRTSAWPDLNLEQSLQRALAANIGLKDIGRIAADVATRLAIESCEGNLQKAAGVLGVTDRALQMRRAGSREKS